MNFIKLIGIWTAIGAVLGIALYSIVYMFRDSFEAAADLGKQIPYISGKGVAILFVPGLATGWLAFTLASRLSEDAGIKRWGPVVLGLVIAVGTALALEQEYLQSMFRVLAVPTIYAGVIAICTVGVLEWMES